MSGVRKTRAVHNCLSMTTQHQRSQIERMTTGPANVTCMDGRTGPVATPGTETVTQSFSVRYEFPVMFTRGVFALHNDALLTAITGSDTGSQRRRRVLMFVDAAVTFATPELLDKIHAWFEARSDQLELTTAPMTIDAGEAIKNDWDALEPMRALVRDEGIDRHSYVIAIGGGALLDAVGLVAATAHRGIRHIRLPTTVLAQNDSGVGVKNGINQYGQKNYLGTFAPPWAVVNDADFLDTLSTRDQRAGMAEAVKVALIRDAAFFTWLQDHAGALAAFERDAVSTMVRRCAELHMHQIGRGGDPFELGSARPLDFGHWAAHRLETLTAHSLRHGEAVAIGIALDTRYSVATGLLAEGLENQVAELLEALGFTLWDEALQRTDTAGVSELLIGLEHFRTHLGGELTITLLEALGRGVEVHEMDASRVLESIDWLHSRTGGAA